MKKIKYSAETAGEEGQDRPSSVSRRAKTRSCPALQDHKSLYAFPRIQTTLFYYTALIRFPLSLCCQLSYCRSKLMYLNRWQGWLLNALSVQTQTNGPVQGLHLTAAASPIYAITSFYRAPTLGDKAILSYFLPQYTDQDRGLSCASDNESQAS